MWGCVTVRGRTRPIHCSSRGAHRACAIPCERRAHRKGGECQMTSLRCRREFSREITGDGGRSWEVSRDLGRSREVSGGLRRCRLAPRRQMPRPLRSGAVSPTAKKKATKPVEPPSEGGFSSTPIARRTRQAAKAIGGEVCSVAWNADGSQLATGCDDDNARVLWPVDKLDYNED